MISRDMQLIPQLEPYRGLIVGLLEDVQGLAELASADTQFIRRATIRTFFSVLEGMVNVAKQFLLDNFFSCYTPEEIVALKESSVKINEKGNIDEKDYYPKVHENVLFTLRMIQKGADNAHEIDRKSPEWRTFLDFIKLRHDLTHPKVASNLVVSKEQLEQLGWIGFWMIDNILEATCACRGRSNPESKKLKAGWRGIASAINIAKYKSALNVLADPTFECADDVRKGAKAALQLILKSATEELDGCLQTLAEHG